MISKCFCIGILLANIKNFIKDWGYEKDESFSNRSVTLFLAGLYYVHQEPSFFWNFPCCLNLFFYLFEHGSNPAAAAAVAAAAPQPPIIRDCWVVLLLVRQRCEADGPGGSTNTRWLS